MRTISADAAIWQGILKIEEPVKVRASRAKPIDVSQWSDADLRRYRLRYYFRHEFLLSDRVQRTLDAVKTEIHKRGA